MRAAPLYKLHHGERDHRRELWQSLEPLNGGNKAPKDIDKDVRVCYSHSVLEPAFLRLTAQLSG
jgi:hypothetical protein